MTNSEENIKELFQKYLKNQCTPDEAKQVLEWLTREEYDAEHIEVITPLLAKLAEEGDKTLVAEELKSRLDKNLEAILKKIETGRTGENKKVRRLNWYRWAAAAVLILMIGSGYLFFVHDKLVGSKDIANKDHQLQNDIGPGSNKAVLTLEDGRVIVLDSAYNGSLALQGNSMITKDGDVLTYNASGSSGQEMYNTMSTPKGGQYQLTLADGSKVWLNSASSIRFPVAFTGTTRRVEITGEVYFEVAKNEAKPFLVSFPTPDGKTGEVTVLGTRFNVMAYTDEGVAKTTLVEGSVKISCNGNSAQLSPRQQASIKNENMKVQSNVDVEEVIAWKEGFFQFNGASLPQVMRQIARWYDVDVSYEGNVSNRKFGGKISRDNNVSEILKILELSKIKYKIEGRKIIIMQ